MGSPPNQHPRRFISPTEVAIRRLEIFRPGNKSPERIHTAKTELSNVKGTCGRAPRVNPLNQFSAVGTKKENEGREYFISASKEGYSINKTVKPAKNKKSADGKPLIFLNKTMSIPKEIASIMEFKPHRGVLFINVIPLRTNFKPTPS